MDVLGRFRTVEERWGVQRMEADFLGIVVG
jgi:hypothetical protein